LIRFKADLGSNPRTRIIYGLCNIPLTLKDESHKFFNYFLNAVVSDIVIASKAMPVFRENHEHCSSLLDNFTGLQAIMFKGFLAVGTDVSFKILTLHLSSE